MNNDCEILRELAKQVKEIAELPQIQERKKSWIDFNALKPERPMVLCFPEGAWSELLTPDVLKCTDPMFRGWEWSLRSKIYWWDNIRDDNAIEPFFDIGEAVQIGGYGLVTEYTHGEGKGSYTWKAPIEDIKRDMEKLTFRTINPDRETTKRIVNIASEIFGDILKPRIRGGYWWTLGLTETAIKFLGLENYMFAMYDTPDELHKLMAWLRDETLNYITTLEKEGVLMANNHFDHVGSGGVGYTEELKPSGLVKLKDMWGFCESQETVGISPEMFAEFVMPYQMPILEKFGLNCYGCCEPLERRWKYIKQIPNLRRVSVSPWSDQKLMSEFLGKDYIFSRKPNPSYVCNGFDKVLIKEDLKKTVQICKDNVLEIILKDTHTIENQPHRIKEWVKMAMSEVGCS